MTQQTEKSVSPSNMVIDLHREALGTDRANAKQLFCVFFPALPVPVHAGKKKGDSARMSSQRKLELKSA